MRPAPAAPHPGPGALALCGAAAMAVGMRGWPKERQRGVFQPYILVMQAAALATIGVMGPRAGQAAPLDPATLAYVAPALLGATCGLRLFRGLTDRRFGIAVNLLLVAAGLGLML